MAPLAAFIALSFSLSAFAAPSTGGRVHYGPSRIPSVWKKVGSAVESAPISFTLAMTPRDDAGLTTRMEQIAASKGHWLTDDELKTYIEPTEETKATVAAALQSIGAIGISYSMHGDKVTVSTTVSKAAKFFGATFHQYEINGETTHKTTQYTIPAAISEHVTDVFPIATFGHAKRTLKVSPPMSIEEREIHERATPSGCSTSSVTSACYRALYGYSGYQPTTSTGTARVGIMAYIGQNYSPTDLATWISKYRTDAKGYSITVNTSNGAKNTPSNPGVEAALDTQTIAGIIYPLPSTFYDVGTASTSGDIFLLSFNNFLNVPVASRPTVISISYGGDESDQTSSQATTMCNAAKSLAASGMTIVASSGDTGVDGQGDVDCPPFVPTYPGGCPYILSAGATQSFSPEVMVDTSLAGFYSGAGFSNYFTTPSYQTSQVSAYISKLNGKYSGDYNAKGRAFPDVSAQGSRQPVVASGSVESVGGTSCSAPIISGGLTLLNDLLLKAGKGSTGWINPTLYANPSAFTDVTSGGSYGCSDGSGLPAESGWDASSGLGTPIFANLRTVYGV